MSSDRDTTNIVRSWLEEGVSVLPDRVLDEVLAHVPTTPQRRQSLAGWRNWQMSSFVRLGVAGAAVVAIIVAAAFLLGRGNVGVIGPSVVPTSSLTLQPFPDGRISPMTARYAIELPHAQLDAVMTLDQGWHSGGWFVRRGQAAVIFYTPENVNADACHQDKTLPDPAIGPTVDDFLNALSAQRNSEMTSPEDVTIAGTTAKRIELQASANAPCRIVRWWTDPCCGEPAFRGTGADAAGRANPDTVWVLDVDGQRVAVVAYWDHSNIAMGRAILDLVNSLEFAPR